MRPFLLALATLALLVSCAPVHEVDDGRIDIIASSFPAYDAARAIVGEDAKLSMLLPVGSDSHSYEPSAEDAVRIAEADLFVYNGGEGDSWIEDLVDEHVWTSLENEMAIVDSLCAEISSLDPEKGEAYRRRADAYIAQIENLRQAFVRIVADAQRRTIVVADRFPLIYFAREFGLDWLAAYPGCAAGSEPSVRTVAAMIDFVRDNDIPVVLHMENANTALSSVIADETGARVLVYRFPNLFGKWCRPNYNSAVATFCNNIANGLPIQVNDRSTELELVYIDDLVDEMVAALAGKEHRCEFDGLNPVAEEDGRYCYVPVSHRATLGGIVDLLHRFAGQPESLVIPEIPKGSFAKKLYSTYLSYLPKEKVAFPLKMNVDERGSFTEMLRSEKCGQVSVNISRPGVTKGQHWHNTKWEFFIVVSGRGLIQQRRVGSDEVIEFEVSGEDIRAVHMLPGYTHNIINLSDTENLVTVMWANEVFDPDRPDTYFEPVK